MRGLVLLALLVPSAAWAIVPPISLEVLCGRATRIVIGRVTGRTARWEGTLIVTDGTIEREQDLKGGGAQRLKVRIPGGTVRGVTLRVSDAPVFRVGERVVLFVKPCQSCDVYGWFRGKYTIVGDKIRELNQMPLDGFRSAILSNVRK